ncbi:MAG: type VI secretion system baseplate subunit TssF [Thiomicrorhabdus sp.]|nr:type VI secretion system baseplate subunit TssF [Thiomicrorhabdus sp.]
MSLKQIFRDELAYLRLQGKEFSQQNPGLSRFLSDESTDPDIERLLEGFAFLSARLRHKIEDDFPELTHTMLNLLWPNYLRPVPSSTIIQFSPVEHAITGKQVIPRHTQLRSKPVDGTACLFRCTHEVPIYPLSLTAADGTASRESSVMGLDFKTLSSIPFNETGCDHLPIFISEDDYTAQILYLWIFQYLDHVRVITDGDRVTTLPASCVKPMGFSSEDALLPYPDNVFDGYRILQEYLSNPERFYFFDVTQLDSVWPTSTVDTIRIEFCFNRPLPEDIKVRKSSFALYCTPAVNLFEYDADPIRLTGKATDYPLRPSDRLPDHYEVFSIDRVTGWASKEKDRQQRGRSYKAFESFEHELESMEGRPVYYFQSRIQRSLSNVGFSHSIRFMRDDDTHFDPNETETISIELTCSNRDLPNALAVGDICLPTEQIPSFITFRNITRPTAALRPLLDESLHWNLVSNMSQNYRTLLKPEPLCNMINSYDFRASVDQQARRHSQQRLAGICDIKTSPIDLLLEGLPIRGLKSELYLDPDKYLSEGEMFLFGTVLSHFFSLFSSINSFHSLDVINTHNKEVYTWPLRTGNRPLI